jgi:hypothetical protein
VVGNDIPPFIKSEQFYPPALRALYSLRSQKTCSSACSPSPHSYSAVVTMLNPLKLAVRLDWPAHIRLIDKKARRFIFISGNHGYEPFHIMEKLLLPNDSVANSFLVKKFVHRWQCNAPSRRVADSTVINVLVAFPVIRLRDA